MNMENKDTPRTDEQINGKPCTRFAILAGDSLRDALVTSEFARQLERELNQALRERDEARKEAESYRYCMSQTWLALGRSWDFNKSKLPWEE